MFRILSVSTNPLGNVCLVVMSVIKQAVLAQFSNLLRSQVTFEHLRSIYLKYTTLFFCYLYLYNSKTNNKDNDNHTNQMLRNIVKRWMLFGSDQGMGLKTMSIFHVISLKIPIVCTQKVLHSYVIEMGTFAGRSCKQGSFSKICPISFNQPTAAVI